MRMRSWCLALAASTLLAGAAVAQDFPAKSLRFLVPFPPGGAVDILGRSLAQPMSRALGQNVVVENRPGGNTVLGAELVLRAPADGHTLFLMAPSFTVNPLVRSDMPYDTFVTWQIAGDMLPDANKEQILATGFFRNHKYTEEGGVIPEEYRIEYNLDKTKTYSKGIIGLTVECAQCHDHKYDPFSQKAY